MDRGASWTIYSPWGHKESDMTDFTFLFHIHKDDKRTISLCTSSKKQSAFISGERLMVTLAKMVSVKVSIRVGL